VIEGADAEGRMAARRSVSDSGQTGGTETSGTETSGTKTSLSAERRAEAGRELDDLAGGWGVPAAVQFAADRLPGSTTADVAYDFSIAVDLLLGDLATVLDAEGES